MKKQLQTPYGLCQAIDPEGTGWVMEQKRRDQGSMVDRQHRLRKQRNVQAPRCCCRGEMGITQRCGVKWGCRNKRLIWIVIVHRTTYRLKLILSKSTSGINTWQTQTQWSRPLTVSMTKLSGLFSFISMNCWCSLVQLWLPVQLINEGPFGLEVIGVPLAPLENKLTGYIFIINTCCSELLSLEKLYVFMWEAVESLKMCKSPVDRHMLSKNKYTLCVCEEGLRHGGEGLRNWKESPRKTR